VEVCNRLAPLDQISSSLYIQDCARCIPEHTHTWIRLRTNRFLFVLALLSGTESPRHSTFYPACAPSQSMATFSLTALSSSSLIQPAAISISGKQITKTVSSSCRLGTSSQTIGSRFGWSACFHHRPSLTPLSLSLTLIQPPHTMRATARPSSRASWASTFLSAASTITGTSRIRLRRSWTIAYRPSQCRDFFSLQPK